ncbi:MAG: hypothetical protein WB689_22325 [Xanthobacteraceae bacterium]
MTADPETHSVATKVDYRELVTVIVALSIPFIITVVLLHWLQDHISTFHGSDEELFYPIIQQFVETFPRMQLWDYQSATTPLFYVAGWLGQEREDIRARYMVALFADCRRYGCDAVGGASAILRGVWISNRWISVAIVALGPTRCRVEPAFLDTNSLWICSRASRMALSRA